MASTMEDSIAHMERKIREAEARLVTLRRDLDRAKTREQRDNLRDMITMFEDAADAWRHDHAMLVREATDNSEDGREEYR